MVDYQITIFKMVGLGAVFSLTKQPGFSFLIRKSRAVEL